MEIEITRIRYVGLCKDQCNYDVYTYGSWKTKHDGQDLVTWGHGDGALILAKNDENQHWIRVHVLCDGKFEDVRIDTYMDEEQELRELLKLVSVSTKCDFGRYVVTTVTSKLPPNFKHLVTE